MKIKNPPTNFMHTLGNEPKILFLQKMQVEKIYDEINVI